VKNDRMLQLPKYIILAFFLITLNCTDEFPKKHYCTFYEDGDLAEYATHHSFAKQFDGSFKVSYTEADNSDEWSRGVITITLPPPVTAGRTYLYSDIASGFVFVRSYGILSDDQVNDDFELTVNRWDKKASGTFHGMLVSTFSEYEIVSGTFEAEID
jgi:hypothetical protein